jgi:hypothetical protein
VSSLRATTTGRLPGTTLIEVAGEGVDVGSAGLEQGQLVVMAPLGELAQVERVGVAGQPGVAPEEPGQDSLLTSLNQRPRSSGVISAAASAELDDLGGARATIARLLCTACCFYRHAVDEGVREHLPATDVRRPRLGHETHAVGLDRNEVGAMLVSAGPSGARDHASISAVAGRQGPEGR